jgi:hypothetical protein
MCSVSFLPKKRGFYLAMNRDEKRDRFAALAPAVIDFEGHRAVFPTEPTGGTWICANDAGVCLALINWHRIKREPKNGTLSRGLVVKELAGKFSVDAIGAAIKKLPLSKLRPFRLIAITSREMRLTEWRWNLERLTIHNHQWQRQHWFSSGFDEARAERVRAKICASFVAGDADAGKRETPHRGRSTGVNPAGHSVSWLRQLHRSHEPARGPFSICMHRLDASTVSYTEVAVSGCHATMRYKPGPSCSKRAMVERTISLARSL